MLKVTLFPNGVGKNEMKEQNIMFVFQTSSELRSNISGFTKEGINGYRGPKWVPSTHLIY